MGLFSKRSKEREPAVEETGTPAALSWDVADPSADDIEDDGRPVRPELDPPGEAERARIANALQRLADYGVDVDDLDSLGEAFDRATAAARAGQLKRDDAVEVIGLGVGEYLVRHARMDWQLITDVFGTDLGVVGRRRQVSVIPTNIVATRWIRGEAGWLPGVVGHLAQMSRGD